MAALAWVGRVLSFCPVQLCLYRISDLSLSSPVLSVDQSGAVLIEGPSKHSVGTLTPLMFFCILQPSLQFKKKVSVCHVMLY